MAQQVKLPSGYHLQRAGQFQEQKRAAARIGLVIPIALVLICVVLYLALNSVRKMILPPHLCGDLRLPDLAFQRLTLCVASACG